MSACAKTDSGCDGSCAAGVTSITLITLGPPAVTLPAGIALERGMTASAPLTMYTTAWCGYCARLKTALQAADIGFTEVDIESDDAAAEFVAEANGGNQTVPTVKFADGSTMTNPDIREVQEKLAG